NNFSPWGFNASPWGYRPFRPYNNGLYFGWNTWNGWNLGYNYNWGYSSPYWNNGPGWYNWGYSVYDPWGYPFAGSYCYNYGGFYPGYSYPYNGFGNNGFYGNDYLGYTGSSTHYGHLTPISSSSSENSQYDGGTILTQAGDKTGNVSMVNEGTSRPDIALVKPERPDVSQAQLSPQESKTELTAAAPDRERPSLIVSKPEMMADVQDKDRVETYTWRPSESPTTREDRNVIPPSRTERPSFTDRNRNNGQSTRPSNSNNSGSRTNPSRSSGRDSNFDFWNSPSNDRESRPKWNNNNSRNNNNSSTSPSRSNSRPSSGNSNFGRSSGSSKSSGGSSSSSRSSSSRSSSSGKRR
ncbi:MAG: hypothetical protein HKN32_06445, partial [Flavobacteriales bacterium]|nr:hypothetical protein [Flavobacteriales bacterium]